MARSSGRGLDEVLHFFISEEEQAEARARTGQKPPAAAGTWALAAHPGRLFQGLFAVELARALAGDEGAVRIVTSIPPHPLLPRDAHVHWRVIKRPDRSDTIGELLRDAVEAEPTERAALLALPAEELAPAVASWPDAAPLRGVLLPVEASRSGLGAALGALRLLVATSSELDVGAVFIGSQTGSDVLHRKLDGAARRQLGRGLRDLGSVARDATDHTALLQARTVFDTDPDAPSACSLVELAIRLGGPS